MSFHSFVRSAFGLTAVLSLLSLAAPMSAQSLAPATYGGRHEFGVMSGYSPAGGPIWGYQQNVRYSPTTVRYSYPVTDLFHRWELRYSPELTVLSIMRELAPSSTNPAAPITHYGAGVNPVGFQVVFRPHRRLQPYFSTNAGVLYYNGRVLSPQGSQFMFTIDFGGGVNLFASPHNALQLGYKYQHLSNANISDHNPGTDADTLYVGYSHFWSKKN